MKIPPPWQAPMNKLLPVIAGLSVTLAAACGGSSSDSKAPIKIGLIVSLTGNYAALGSEDYKAVELAVDQQNAAGGLLGRKIQIVFRDDRTQPDQAVLAFNDIKGQGLTAVIGPVFSNAALAVEPLAQRTFWSSTSCRSALPRSWSPSWPATWRLSTPSAA